MNLNDFFSKPTRIKEAYTNNYPSYTPPAAAAAASSDSDSVGEPKFDRVGKTGKEPEFDFRKGLVGDDDTDYETENEPELGTFRMGKPVEPDDAATNAFMAAFQGAGEQNADNSRRLEPGEFNAGGTTWRFVRQGENPARYGSDTTVSGTGTPNWRSIAADPKSASASGLPKMRFDIASQRMVPVDAPPALDLTPKRNYKLNLPSGQVPVDVTGANANSIKSGPNPNINDETRAKALAWAARKNAIAAVKPVAATPAATLRDIPVEKPGSVKDIARGNNIANPDRIMPGQVLKIPGRADYVVQPGDTLSKIAAGQTKPPKITPSFGDTQPAATAVLKKNPNLGLNFPLPRSVQDNLGMGPETTRDAAGKLVPLRRGEREELLTPAIIKRQKEAALNRTPADVERVLAANEKANAARIAARDAEIKAQAAAASRKKVKEDDIDNQTQVSSIERDSTSDIDGKTNQSFSSTSFQQDPANPGNNSYMNRQDNNGVASTTYARNVTPKWMSNLKATAGLPGAKPAAQPPSQYPTQVGQGMNNRPFAAYSTLPGQLEVNRESLDRMQSLAGIRKK
jgi:LysM repeat protein